MHPDGHDRLERLACRGIQRHADLTTRRQAAAVLRGHGRTHVADVPIADLLDVHDRAAQDLADQQWSAVRDLAATFPDIAAELADLLAAGLGGDAVRWRTLLALGDSFPGTVADLLTTIVATTGPAAG